ncbi:aspartyl-phosphate phosphatase Spo0E family protein [Virgibacillus kimchii]
MIEDKKEEMLRFSKEHGINSEETLNCSQELDELILQYQMQARKRLKNSSKHTLE